MPNTFVAIDKLLFKTEMNNRERQRFVTYAFNSITRTPSQSQSPAHLRNTPSSTSTFKDNSKQLFKNYRNSSHNSTPNKFPLVPDLFLICVQQLENAKSLLTSSNHWLSPECQHAHVCLRISHIQYIVCIDLAALGRPLT